MVGVKDAANACDPRDVLIDRAIDEIERELGHLPLCQRIAVVRVLETYAADIPRVSCAHPACPRGELDWC